MRLGRKGLWLAACCTAILAPAAPAEAKGKIVSQWLDREIIIDGELDEWRDALVAHGRNPAEHENNSLRT